MTIQVVGKQLNSISDKTDGSNPRMRHFLLYFSIVVVWGFSLSYIFFGRFIMSVFYRGAICFLVGLFSSAYFPRIFHTLFISVPLLFLSLFPPHACTHTHDQILSPFDSSFSSLSSLVFPMQQPSQKCHKNSLYSWYVNTTKAVTVTVFSPRHRRWVFFHWPQRFLLPKIQNALLLPPLSLKTAQLLPSWMKTNFRGATIPRCICPWHKCRLKSSDPTNVHLIILSIS